MWEFVNKQLIFKLLNYLCLRQLSLHMLRNDGFQTHRYVRICQCLVYAKSTAESIKLLIYFALLLKVEVRNEAQNFPCITVCLSNILIF